MNSERKHVENVTGFFPVINLWQKICGCLQKVVEKKRLDLNVFLSKNMSYIFIWNKNQRVTWNKYRKQTSAKESDVRNVAIYFSY